MVELAQACVVAVHPLGASPMHLWRILFCPCFEVLQPSAGDFYFRELPKSGSVF